MRYLLIFSAAVTLAQRTPELTIAQKSASAVGDLIFEDLTGNKLKIEAPNSLTAHTLRLPGTLAAGCLTATGGGILSWAGCVSLPITDSLSLLKNAADATKTARFDLSNIPTGIATIAYFPSAAFTMVGLELQNQFTNTNRFRDITFDIASSRSIGDSGVPAAAIWSDNFSSNSSGTTVNAPNGTMVTTRIDSSFSNGQTYYGFNYYTGPNSFSQTRFVDNARNGSFVNLTITGTCTGCPAGAAGISSINGQTNSSQTLQTGTSGSNFNIASSGGFHTFNLPDASIFARGLVTTGTQSFAGDKTLQGSFLPSAASIYSNGNLSYPWFNLTARKFEVSNGAGSSFSLQIDSSNFLRLRDQGGNIVMQWDSSSFPYSASVPYTFYSNNGGNLGYSGLPWGTTYTANLVIPSYGSMNAYVGSGNFYNRVFAGTPSCSGVADGWTGIDSYNQRIWVCLSGVAKWTLLN